MAKKTVTAPAAASGEAPKQSQESKLRIRGRLEYFWDYTELAWDYCERHLERLSVFAPYLTKDFIAQQLAYIAEVQQLPNNEVRSSGNAKSLLAVKAKRQAVLEKANLLDAALRFANQNAPALYPVERKAAGLVAFREASDSNYSAVSIFLTTASNYLDANGQRLVEMGALPTDFVQGFKDLGTAFNDLKKRLNTGRQTSKDGTSTVAAGVEKIKQQVSLMQEFGKQAFKYEPELLKLFTEDYLFEAVRSKHHAGMDGTTALPPVDGNSKGKPLANILVEVLGMPGKTATTNKLGRYVIKQMAAGEYMVRYSGPVGASEGITPVELKVVLSAGVSRRVNVTLEPAPTASRVASPAPVATGEPALDTALLNAVSELMVKPKAANGVHEGAAA